MRYRDHYLGAVVDPGFPRGRGANPPGGGANIGFCQIFPKNWMKLKEFGPRGEGASLTSANSKASNESRGLPHLINS